MLSTIEIEIRYFLTFSKRLLFIIAVLNFLSFALIKVDFVVLSPSMFCYVGTGFILLDVGLTYIAPRAVRATNRVHDVGLFFGKWSVLWWRKTLF
jgi:hypothetical protein